MSIAFKEGVKINPHTLQEIIIASNNDIRQVRGGHHWDRLEGDTIGTG